MGPICAKMRPVEDSSHVVFEGFVMKRFIEGAVRSQITLFPERLDDYVQTTNRCVLSICLILLTSDLAASFRTRQVSKSIVVQIC